MTSYRARERPTVAVREGGVAMPYDIMTASSSAPL